MTINGLGSSLGSFGVSGRNTLDQEAFIQLLVTELSGQNPFEPLSDKDLFQQVATLTSVQGINELRVVMEMSRAQSLLGHQVDYFNAQGELCNGIVDKLTFDGDYVYLHVNGDIIYPEDVFQDYGLPSE
jgi:flagellar hook assembly protein FlgD